MHVLPSLAALEARYQGQPVTVVGVHSAKFDNEKASRPLDALRAAFTAWTLQHSPQLPGPAYSMGSFRSVLLVAKAKLSLVWIGVGHVHQVGAS